MARLVPLFILVDKNRKVTLGDVEIGDTGLLTGEITATLYMEEDGKDVEVNPMYVSMSRVYPGSGT